MYVVFLAGGIASGKSSVARELERLGAWRVDLDEISREVLEPGSETLVEIAQAFGPDLVNAQTGILNRRLLAERAFATPEGAKLLEDIELPAIERRLIDILTHDTCAGSEPVCCVVEVPLLDRVGAAALGLADEVVAVTCPAPERVRRAVERGMDPEDAEARIKNQPTDAWLRAHADTVFENVGTYDELLTWVQAWWNKREQRRWKATTRRG